MKLVQISEYAYPKQSASATMRLSYELEAIIHQEVVSPGKSEGFSFIDEVAGEPVASRQAINVVAYADGSADYLIEEQQPEHIDLPSSFEGVPANDIPPVAKTKVTGGMAYFYDSQDNLLYQHPMEEDYSMRDQIAVLTGKYDWKAEALAVGGKVEELEEGRLLIRKPVFNTTQQEEGPALRTAAGRYTEDVVIPELNLLLGSSLFEANGELVSRMVNKYNYQEDKGQWQPEMMYYEEHGTNEVTGSQYVSKTTYYYNNYSLQIN